MTVHTLVTALPDPEVLRARCRALALLDALLDPAAPTHTFFPEWRPGVDLALMDNGSGDQYAVAFDPAGVFLHGFDHECAATPGAHGPAPTGPDSSTASRPPSRTTPRTRSSSSRSSSTRRSACGARRTPLHEAAARSPSPPTHQTAPTGSSPSSPTAPRTPTPPTPRTTSSTRSTAPPSPPSSPAPPHPPDGDRPLPTADFAAMAVRARELGHAVDDRTTA
ncbi:hypothetical protein OIM90_11310 [Streptomyces sp. AD16]|nr:hypothetical protein OIM90_11310 [Streptomyces sp. AD16]